MWLHGGGPLCFWHYGSSHLFMRLLCSSCEDLHSISFRELVSIGGRRSSLYVLYPGGHLWSYAWGIHFRFGQRSPSIICCSGFSRVAAESLGFLLSCDRDLREPLMLPQGSQASFQVSRGTSGFLLSRCRGIGPHLELKWETQGSSPVATGISGFLSSFNTGVRPCLVLMHGTPLFSQVVTRLSGLLLSSEGSQRVGYK